jgi:alkanesulfonate monooxygenase SsuD/methylene tetrahydromethanopterin reductase-like flavin-dependent oxidoreductase (luciferase family)
MLDREGARTPSGVAVVGDEAEVQRQIEHLAAIGATDFVANVFGSSEERAETYGLLRSIL